MSQPPPGTPDPRYQPPGQPPGQNQYGPPAQNGPAGPMATIALTIQGSVMTSSMIVPSVLINGQLIPTRYGRQDIPVHPGQMRIEAYTEWMRRYGQASLDVTPQAGQVVPVFYASPLHQFTTGSMGHEKQKRKGMGLLIGVLGVIFVMLALCMVLAIFV